ncbi:LysR family transcriptional regulator [Massilia sp. TSP1-1-2]|uniref:LysR family transcriptional regulator n=1 Tax=unclassified Massilia TaxID=2609279 RepID=UPI003CED2D45
MSPPLASLDWNLLNVFMHLVDAGSLSKAARSSGMSQPTLSRQISTLEQQLGIILFDRSSRGMQLTVAGRQLVERAGRMRHEAGAIARAAQAISDEVAGTVRLAASELTAVHILPPILTDIRRRHPAIEFEVLASNDIANLLEREADIAIRMAAPGQGELVARKVGQLEMGIYAHRSYLDLRGTPHTLEQLLECDLIGFDRDDSLRRGLLAAGAAKDRLRFAFRSDSHDVCWQMVRSGFGCGFVTKLVAATDTDVVRLMPSAAVPPLPVWLTVHREVRSSRRLRLVYDALALALATLTIATA